MTSVIIPWRQGCPFRERALAWVLDRWAERFPTFDVVLGVHDDGPWCKAAAVADGLSKVADGSLIIADADVWLVRPEALTDAVGALSDHGWAIPHGDVQRLTETASEAFMADQPLPPRPWLQTPYPGWAGGGIVVTTTDTYRQAPLDRRFSGWGQEDASWALALHTLVGKPWRGDTPLVHLFHPPQKRYSRQVGSLANKALHSRYHGAHRKPDVMRALIAEAA